MTHQRWFGLPACLALLAAWLIVATDVSAAAGAPRWSADERALLDSLRLARLPAAPADRSNAVEGLPAAVAFGQRLFQDPRFSRDGSVSCASCHDPAKQFQDDRPLGQGVGRGGRRTMPIVGLAHGAWLFWDGRKDSAWSQALGPLEDGVEHGGNRLRYAHLIRQHYRSEYESLFRPLPDLDGLPRDAGPLGTPADRAAWAALDERRRTEVSRVFADMGKAIAAYEKSLRHAPSRVDRGLDVLAGPGGGSGSGELSAEELRGLRLFIGKAQCATCHAGALYTDQQFHNTGVPPRPGTAPDRGRAAATAKVRADEFNCLGPFSDAPPAACRELRFMVDDGPALEGAFKTPGLRGVAGRAPYMHAGQFATLEEVVDHYLRAPRAAVGHSELVPPGHAAGGEAHAERLPIRLSDEERRELLAFLRAL